jgi:hypothetical protein
MKNLVKVIAVLGFVGFSAQTIADDSSSAHYSKAMKDCMAKQKAANSNMTQAAMETVCKNETKPHKDKDGNDLATAPKAPPKQ